jgi:hypothetical protein
VTSAVERDDFSLDEQETRWELPEIADSFRMPDL